MMQWVSGATARHMRDDIFKAKNHIEDTEQCIHRLRTSSLRAVVLSATKPMELPHHLFLHFRPLRQKWGEHAAEAGLIQLYNCLREPSRATLRFVGHRVLTQQAKPSPCWLKASTP